MFETVLPYIWGAVGMLILITIIDRFQPIVSSSKGINVAFVATRLAIKKLKEGTLLAASNQAIRELGEAAVVFGMDTSEANTLMLEAIKEQRLEQIRSSFLRSGEPYNKLPGYLN